MTARYADRVALMNSNGSIAETGDPRHLMGDEDSRLWALINKASRHGVTSMHHERRPLSLRPYGNT